MAAAAGVSLSGCVSSPTYGPGKTANAQLLDDVSHLASFGQGSNKPHINYKPRPDLVRPGPGDKGQLPPPQTSLASSSDPNWPESPEERRKRLRDEITANRDKPGFVSPIEMDDAGSSNNRLLLPSGSSRAEDYAARNPVTDEKRLAELKARRLEETQGSPTQRKYLSEPPLSYRQPAATAPVGQLGEDEAKKERERKKAMGQGKSWRDYLPWN